MENKENNTEKGDITEKTLAIILKMMENKQIRKERKIKQQQRIEILEEKVKILERSLGLEERLKNMETFIYNGFKYLDDKIEKYIDDKEKKNIIIEHSENMNEDKSEILKEISRIDLTLQNFILSKNKDQNLNEENWGKIEELFGKEWKKGYFSFTMRFLKFIKKEIELTYLDEKTMELIRKKRSEEIQKNKKEIREKEIAKEKNKENHRRNTLIDTINFKENCLEEKTCMKYLLKQ